MRQEIREAAREICQKLAILADQAKSEWIRERGTDRGFAEWWREKAPGLILQGIEKMRR